MRRVVHIGNHKNLTINKHITEYIKPQIIYIPLESKTGVKYVHNVKEGDYVYKGEVVAKNKDINFPIHSSVSGYVISGNKKIINNGRKIKCIVVENDFKEKYENRAGTKKDITKYTKEEFIDLLRSSGITGLGGSDFPTYIKYLSCDNFNCFIINGVECESFVTSDYALMRESAEAILEGIDAILEIMGIKKGIIALKENNTVVINEFKKYIGTYPNISLGLMEDAYPNGWERSIVRELLGVTYSKYPSEKGILVSNVSTVYAIYDMLKNNRPLTERVITITGSGIKKPQNVRVKIGALMSEIINHIDGYKDLKNPLFIAGGPMMGKSLATDDLLVTKDLGCVLVMENNLTTPKTCINCGKCTEVCPVSLMPVLIMKNLDNKERLKYLKPTECIECGLCSYICPSKIEVREYVRSAKEKEGNNGV